MLETFRRLTVERHVRKSVVAKKYLRFQQGGTAADIQGIDRIRGCVSESLLVHQNEGALHSILRELVPADRVIGIAPDRPQ